MARRISVEKLNDMIADPDLREAELRPYLELDEDRSGPMSPVLKLNEDTVDIPTDDAEARARGDVALASFNFLSRLRRQADFHRRIARGYGGPIIVSEGDSWFQYPILLDDVIDHLLEDYPIMSLGAAGDTLQRMFERDEFTRDVRRYDADILLLSGAGNDLLAGGDLRRHLRTYDPTLSPAAHLLPSFDGMVDAAARTFDRIFRKLERDFPGLAVICHGYDRPVPTRKGKWLGKPMISRGIKDAAVQKAIAGEMIDRFNVELNRVTAAFVNVTYIDARGVVTDTRWHDELHPTDKGYKDVAKLFKRAIKAATPRRVPRSRTVASVDTTARTGPAVVAPGRRGMSLHVGLNNVDPAHYADWDGALNACEFDAVDMAEIAKSMGYRSKLLLTKTATRDRVRKEIQRAARTLKAGDIFWLSYSGHGGQLPDVNGDEQDRIDETWCLYDAQMIDDELYMLWSEFSADVRVLVISDSCHSGSVIRRVENDPVVGNSNRPNARFMPLRIASRVHRRNREFYEKIGRSLDMADDAVLSKELVTPLSCSVRLISGCQDNQKSFDGFDNGQFTSALLRVWDDGAFDGDYQRFHSGIVRDMPDYQTPNHWQVGRPNPAFDGQRPFEI